MKLEQWYPIKLYLRHLPHSIMLGAGLIMNIGATLWLWIVIGRREEPLFLHYNTLFGIDTVGSWQLMFLPVLMGFLIYLCNAVLAWYLFKKERFLSYVINAGSLICQIIVLGVAGMLVFLNV